MTTYILKRGKHYAKGPPGCECTRCAYDRKLLEAKNASQPTDEQKALSLKGFKGHEYTFEPGNCVIESDRDLVSYFGAEKFELDTREISRTPPKPAPEVPAPNEEIPARVSESTQESRETRRPRSRSSQTKEE